MLKQKFNNLLRLIRVNGFSSTLKHYIIIIYVYFIGLLKYNKLKNDWKPLKDKYKGKRVFLIGNGPSLNETPLYLLKDEFTMCFNRFNVMFERLNWTPTFYMCVDDLVAKNISQDINNEIVPKTKFSFFPLIHNRGTDFRKFIKNKNNVKWLIRKSEDNKINIPKSTMGPSVSYPALEILNFMGFSEIYIIGMDMNYQIHNTAKTITGNNIESKFDDDPNHFDPRYFGKGKQYHQPVESIVNEIFDSLERANKKAAKTNTTIFNATYGGKVETFKRVNFESLFLLSDSAKFKLFIMSIGIEIENKEKLYSLFPLKISVDDISNCTHFSLKKDIAVSALKGLILNYIPFGPFEERYYFKQRENRIILE